MLFLVDYENVKEDGLNGCNCLDSGDKLIIFYSHACEAITQRNWEMILTSGCIFEMYKLYKSGKNALDFYIASSLGELVGKGYKGIICIVSRDKGFSAIRDYWNECSKCKNIRVILSPDIESGIVGANESTERHRRLVYERKRLNLDVQYGAYQERMRVRGILHSIFDGTEYEGMINKIQDILENKDKTLKILYINSIHLFGKKKGIGIYHKLKECEELNIYK